ncbi:LysM peptidoglycan-binding domain-containing protein [Kineococcus gynurae]|uniref:LysM peptidoglycan-binding domain-containing protein n=2 Tax=Kineococcus gynurae TaxID=452979 RepID=UPI003D7DB0BB
MTTTEDRAAMADDTTPATGRDDADPAVASGDGSRSARGSDPTTPVNPAVSARASRLLAAALVGAAAPAAVVGAAGPAAAAPGTSVTVRAGDTVGGIAARTGSSVGAIVEANGLGRDARITAGQTLQVPGDAPAPAPTTTYTVRPGDTLSHIAVATGSTVGALRDANGLPANGFIRAGQELTVPGGAGAGTPSAATPDRGATYTVRAGDTLSAIAAAQGTTVADLVRANGLDASSFIVIGQELSLGPGARPRSAAPARGPATEQASSLPAAVEANRERLSRGSVPSRAQMQEIIRREAVRLGVDPSLALAIGYQESGFNMRVVSHANAIGAMQVIPTSGEWASDLLNEPVDLFDPHDNARAGVAILRTLVANNAPDVAIASYYQGQASVRSRGMYDDTRRYVANVQTLQNRFR